jgi:energy-converting hydrogenase Eha subunit A
MPTNLAQWTGIAVTSIVVLGSDMDVIYAVPLGLFAGALATFFSALADNERSAKPSVPPRTARRPRNA